MKSTKLSMVETQRELQLYRQPEPNTMPVEVIHNRKTSGQAFSLACDSSTKSDQEIASFVGIDAGSFSKMKKGLATLQGDDLEKFCYAVNNRIYPEWLAFRVGCTLVMIKSEAERERDLEREARIKAETERDCYLNALQGRAA